MKMKAQLIPDGLIRFDYKKADCHKSALPPTGIDGCSPCEVHVQPIQPSATLERPIELRKRTGHGRSDDERMIEINVGATMVKLRRLCETGAGGRRRGALNGLRTDSCRLDAWMRLKVRLNRADDARGPHTMTASVDDQNDVIRTMCRSETGISGTCRWRV